MRHRLVHIMLNLSNEFSPLIRSMSLTTSKPRSKQTSNKSKLKMTKSKPNTKYKSSKPIASKGTTTFRNKSNI